MSILNLNTPQGHGPTGKKKTKVWMGVGLLVAVLGLGSTFASNITLNSSTGTEFGQGVTQTVFCGGENADVTVTPISSFKNTVIVDPINGIGEATVQLKYRDSGTYFQSRSNSDYVTFNGQSGWWLSSTSSSHTIITDVTPANLVANKDTYVFAKRNSVRDDGRTTYGYYKSGTTSFVTFANPNYVAPVPGSTTPASFRLGGVSISGIPESCAGVDFVLTAYSETGTARTLISSISQTVREVAVFKRTPMGSGTTNALFSVERNAATSSALLTVTESPNQIDIVFDVENGTALDSTVLYKMVVETQEHINRS